MIIQWMGAACFKINGSLQDTIVVCDPFGASAGYRLPRLSADIVIATTDDDLHNASDAVKSAHAELHTIANPGEYEIGGVFIRGCAIEQKDENGKPQWTSIYSMKIDEVCISHLGALNRELNEKELDCLGRTDILLLPVGGHGVLNCKNAVKLIGEIEPRIIIPMDYHLPGGKIARDGLDAFLSEYGIKQPETLDKLKIMKKDLPAEETKVLVLTQS